MSDKFDEINNAVRKVNHKTYLDLSIPANVDITNRLRDAVEEGIKIGRRNALAEIAEGLLKKQFGIDCDLGANK